MDPQQGIMALPESDQAPAPQLSLDESYGAVRQGLQNANPQASQMLDQTLAKFKPMLAQLDDKTLDLFLQLMQYMKQNEAQYPELLQEIIDAGILQPGVFPEQYDTEFLATIMMVLTAERKDRQQSTEQAPAQPEMQPPPGMARGGIADAARAAMSQGRGKDSMLAHITPKEARLLEAHGGMGTTNPATGLKEYGWFSDTVGSISKSIGGAISGIVGKDISNAVNDLGNSVKEVVRSPVGRLVTTVGLSIVMGPVWGSLATSMLAQDDPEEALINAATAFFTSGIDMGIQNAALNSAAAGALAGTGAGLLRGKNLEDSVRAGLIQGAIAGATTGLTKGFSANSTSYDLNNPSQLDGGGADVSQIPQSDVSGADVSSGAKTGVIPPDARSYGTGPVPPGISQNAFARNYGAYNNVNAPAVPSEDVLASLGKASPNGMMYGPNPDIGSTLASQGGYNPDVNAVTGALAPPASVAPPEYKFGSNAVQDALDNSKMDVSDYPRRTSDLADRYLFANEAAERAGRTSPLVPTRYEGVVSAKDLGSQFPGPASAPATTGVQDVSSAVASTGNNATMAGTGFNPPPYAGSAVGTTAAPTPVTGYPSVGTASENIFSGARQMLPGTDGEFSKGYEQFSKGIGQLYSPSMSKADLINTPEYRSAINAGQTEASALKEAAGAIGNDPGVFRSYGPGAATALGATYLMGGFDAAERPKTEQQTEMENRFKTQKADVAASPGTYTPQGLEKYGIMYNDKGEIIGGKPWSPAALTGPTEMPSMSYVPYTPRRYAEGGGIASLAAGGYPRRTGQISGPGTATSDSIPAMLSDGEFVMTAKAVRGAGKGSKLAGAKKMYSLMHQLERNASRK